MDLYKRLANKTGERYWKRRVSSLCLYDVAANNFSVRFHYLSIVDDIVFTD